MDMISLFAMEGSEERKKRVINTHYTNFPHTQNIRFIYDFSLMGNRAINKPYYAPLMHLSFNFSSGPPTSGRIELVCN